MHPDAVQLFYTVAVHSRSELAIAPDEYAGFVMACLRMLSLHGATNTGAQIHSPAVLTAPAQMSSPAASAPAASAISTAAAESNPAPAPVVWAAPAEAPPVVTPPAVQTAGDDPESRFESSALEEPEYLAQGEEYAPAVPSEFSGRTVVVGQAEIAADTSPPAALPAAAPAAAPGSLVLPAPWAVFSTQLPLSGMAAQLGRQSECLGVAGRTITLRVPSKALTEGLHADRLRAVLSEYFGFPVQVNYQVGAVQSESAHTLDLAAQQARQQAAEQTVQNDPFVRTLVTDFGGQVVPGSIRPSPVP